MKYWRPDLLASLTREGLLKLENMLEYDDDAAAAAATAAILNTSGSGVPAGVGVGGGGGRLRMLDDNLSHTPPLYRIKKRWLDVTVPLRGYRFYRVRENSDANDSGDSLCFGLLFLWKEKRN